MYARISTLFFPPERAKEARKQITEQAAPAARNLPGLTRAFWLSDDTSGTLVAVVLYETEGDLVANRETSNKIREGSVKSANGTGRCARCKSSRSSPRSEPG